MFAFFQFQTIVYWLKANAISQNMIQRYLSLPNLVAAKRYFTVQTVYLEDLTRYIMMRVVWMELLFFFKKEIHKNNVI